MLHQIMLKHIGYDTDPNEGLLGWVRNSCGTRFGYDGFFKIAHDVFLVWEEGQCQIIIIDSDSAHRDESIRK